LPAVLPGAGKFRIGDKKQDLEMTGGSKEPGKRLKILMVSPFLPYRGVPHAGGKFIHMLLDYLVQRHDVDLLVRVFPEEIRYLEETSRLPGKIFPLREPPSASPRSCSLTGRLLSYWRLGREANRIVRKGKYDLILVEYTEAGIFLKPRGWPPSILDNHDIITKTWHRRWQGAAGISRPLLRLVHLVSFVVERRTSRKFRVLFTKSREDAAWADKWIRHRDVRVLPIPAGVDMSLFPRQEAPGRLLFLGAMGRKLNVDAALYFYRKVFPVVRERFPDAQFWIVGGNPPEALRELCALDPSVRVTGFVEDIGECYASASVFVAPILIGGGIIVKVLDAMAAGVPVVTTTFGNEGIRAETGVDLFVADTPEDFASKVIMLLEEDGLRRRVGENGRAFVAKRFGKDRILEEFEADLLRIARSG
jgi:glycosyltransferase involved in cell wall biosynthesis